MSSEYYRHFIKNYSDRLRLEGFIVINILETPERMPVFNGVKPEIFARDDNLERIIVVKEKRDYIKSRDALEKLKKYARSNKYTSFWGFIVKDDSWSLVDNII